MASLPIQHQDFAFIDFGSGKGKCLLMASDYPFQRVIGVEFSTELAEIARRNLMTYRSTRQKCRALEVVVCDAIKYTLPPEPSVYYFYNPFEADLMREVRERIRESLAVNQREIYIVYHNAAHRDAFDEVPWLEVVRESSGYCVYRNHFRSPARATGNREKISPPSSDIRTSNTHPISGTIL